MKVVSRLLAALMTAALIVPATAGIVSAAVDINTMAVKPTSGPVGTEVYLEGYGDDDGNGYVYFELSEDDEEWVLVLSNSSSNWTWDEELVDEDPDEYLYYFDTKNSSSRVYRRRAPHRNRGFQSRQQHRLRRCHR